MMVFTLKGAFMDFIPEVEVDGPGSGRLKSSSLAAAAAAAAAFFLRCNKEKIIKLLNKKIKKR